MLTKFDDYPIHQTPDPVAHPATEEVVGELHEQPPVQLGGFLPIGAGPLLQRVGQRGVVLLPQQFGEPLVEDLLHLVVVEVDAGAVRVDEPRPPLQGSGMNFSAVRAARPR